jgi:hypothetical protein
MKIHSALIFPLSASLLLMAAEADARLIKRGGASNVLGFVTGGDSIAPEASGTTIGAGIAQFVGSRKQMVFRLLTVQLAILMKMIYAPLLYVTITFQ